MYHEVLACFLLMLVVNESTDFPVGSLMSSLRGIVDLEGGDEDPLDTLMRSLRENSLIKKATYIAHEIALDEHGEVCGMHEPLLRVQLQQEQVEHFIEEYLNTWEKRSQAIGGRMTTTRQLMSFCRALEVQKNKYASNSVMMRGSILDINEVDQVACLFVMVKRGLLRLEDFSLQNDDYWITSNMGKVQAFFGRLIMKIEMTDILARSLEKKLNDDAHWTKIIEEYDPIDILEYHQSTGKLVYRGKEKMHHRNKLPRIFWDYLSSHGVMEMTEVELEKAMLEADSDSAYTTKLFNTMRERLQKTYPLLEVNKIIQLSQGKIKVSRSAVTIFPL